jgi:hypothetical protein
MREGYGSSRWTPETLLRERTATGLSPTREASLVAARPITPSRTLRSVCSPDRAANAGAHEGRTVLCVARQRHAPRVCVAPDRDSGVQPWICGRPDSDGTLTRAHQPGLRRRSCAARTTCLEGHHAWTRAPACPEATGAEGIRGALSGSASSWRADVRSLGGVSRGATMGRRCREQMDACASSPSNGNCGTHPVRHVARSSRVTRRMRDSEGSTSRYGGVRARHPMVSRVQARRDNEAPHYACSKEIVFPYAA